MAENVPGGGGLAGAFPGMDNMDDVQITDIIEALMTVDKNLPMKTHIKNPVLMSVICVYIKHLRDKGLTKYADLLFTLYKKYLIHMVSDKRMGRKEAFDAIKSAYSMLNPQPTNMDKALGKR